MSELVTRLKREFPKVEGIEGKVGQALRRLDAAEKWGDVRDQLVALHRATHNEVSVIPLWQTVDFFVYNKRLQNIGGKPVWLYQNVDQWRLGAQTVQR